MPFAFLNPWLLFGLPAMSIPLIIHLAQRRKFKVVNWGAMEFLLLSEAKTTRKRKIQNLILLILRTLIILLIVLAAARPLLKGSQFAGILGKENTYAIIIIDDSYSMGAAAGNATSFDRAKKAAEDIISLLKTGDAVTLIRASDPPRALGTPNFHPQLVKNELRDMKLSTRTTNYAGAFAVASQALENVALPRKEVYLVGDCQVEGWKRGTGGEDDPFTEVSKKAQIYVVKVPPASDQNAAVTSVNFPRGLVDTLGITRVMASIKNFGASDLHHIAVQLMVDGREVDRKTIAVKSKTEEFIEFRYRFERPGLHHGSLQLSNDVLEIDNAFYFHATVRNQVKILCVDGIHESEGASRFFQTALNPTGKTYMTIKGIRADQLSSYIDQLHEYQVVVMANVARIGSHEADKLEAYVKQGGAVLIGLGDVVEMLSYNALLHKRGEGIFPGQLVGVKGDARTKKTRFFPSLFLQTHPMLKIFSDVELTDLKSCKVFQYYAMETGQDPRVTILSSLQDGAPLLVEKRTGKGKTIVWTTSLDDSWNDLPTIQHLMFLPLMNQIVSYLAAGGTDPLVVGQPIMKRLSFREYPFQGQLPFIVTPDKELKQAAMSSEEGGYLVRFDQTDVPGSYVLTRQGGDVAHALDRFSINVNTEESNLETVDETRLRALFPEAKFRFLDNEERVREIVIEEQVGVELWKPFLKLLLAVVALEFILAHLFSHSLRAPPVKAVAS